MKNRKFIRPTDEENRAINAGIAADPDTYELSAEEFKTLKPYRRGRPKSENPKEHVNLRLDAEVLKFFRGFGRGWQTRLNSTLLKYVTRRQARGKVVRIIGPIRTTDSIPARRKDKTKDDKVKGDK